MWRLTATSTHGDEPRGPSALGGGGRPRECRWQAAILVALLAPTDWGRHGVRAERPADDGPGGRRRDPAHAAPRGVRGDLSQGRLRPGGLVRRLHGAGGRQGRRLLRAAGVALRGPRGHHPGGPRRAAARGVGGVLRGSRRVAVRLLLPRDPDEGGVPAAQEPRADAPAGDRGARWQPLPVHRLRQGRRRGAAGGRRARRRPAPGRGSQRTRRQPHGALPGPRARARRQAVRQRPVDARDAARRRPVLRPPARAGPADRRLQGAGAPGGRGGADRRRCPWRAQPGRDHPRLDPAGRGGRDHPVRR